MGEYEILKQLYQELDLLFKKMDGTKKLPKTESNPEKMVEGGGKNSKDVPSIICTECKGNLFEIEKKDAERVKSYSEKWYGKILCRDCQFKHKKFVAKQEGSA